VQAVLKACHAMVPRGGARRGHRPVGWRHAPPHGRDAVAGQVQPILKVDAASRTAVVQCGVRNLAISEAAAPYGLYYAPDPSSQIACTIGGNVAENSGGVHCLKYGLTVHNVLKVKASPSKASPSSSADALDAPAWTCWPS
jgi:glycolate oxidase